MRKVRVIQAKNEYYAQSVARILPATDVGVAFIIRLPA